MSRSPLFDLQTSLFTALVAGVTSATIYDWLPDPISFPYVLMEREEMRSIDDKSGLLQTTSAQLLIVSIEPDREELKKVYDEVMIELTTKLVLANNWIVVFQPRQPITTTERVTTHTNEQGHAATLVYTFQLQDTS